MRRGARRHSILGVHRWHLAEASELALNEKEAELAALRAALRTASPDASSPDSAATPGAARGVSDSFSSMLSATVPLPHGELHGRSEQQGRDLFYYKRSYRELKRKLRDAASASGVERERADAALEQVAYEQRTNAQLHAELASLRAFVGSDQNVEPGMEPGMGSTPARSKKALREIDPVTQVAARGTGGVCAETAQMRPGGGHGPPAWENGALA